MWQLFSPRAAEEGAITNATAATLALAIAHPDPTSEKLPAHLREAAAERVSSDLFERLNEEMQALFVKVCRLPAS